MTPLVGINMDYAHRPSGEKRLALNLCYIRAVEAAGGIPVLLPWLQPRTLAKLLPKLDRLVLVGSDDLDPALYGQKRRPEVTLLLDPERQAFDLELVARAWKRGLPTLAICGGCQVLNVARGGSLIQHIPAQVPGALEHAKGRIWHRVRVEKGSRLGRLLGRSSLSTNSYHHQAVDRLGRGLQAVAWSSDGVVEGIENPDHPYLLGVQWHPERCWNEKPAHGALFRALCKS